MFGSTFVHMPGWIYLRGPCEKIRVMYSEESMLLFHNAVAQDGIPPGGFLLLTLSFAFLENFARFEPKTLFMRSDAKTTTHRININPVMH